MGIGADNVVNLVRVLGINLHDNAVDGFAGLGHVSQSSGISQKKLAGTQVPVMIKGLNENGLHDI